MIDLICYVGVAKSDLCRIYECVEEKEIEEEEENDEQGGDDPNFCGIKLIRAYDDPDREEVFYTVAWGHDEGAPIIACGGVRSVVRIIYTNGPGLKEKKFIGHSECFMLKSLLNLTKFSHFS